MKKIYTITSLLLTTILFSSSIVFKLVAYIMAHQTTPCWCYSYRRLRRRGLSTEGDIDWSNLGPLWTSSSQDRW